VERVFVSFSLPLCPSRFRSVIFALALPHSVEFREVKALEATKDNVFVRVVTIAPTSYRCFGSWEKSNEAAVPMRLPQVMVGPPTEKEVKDFVVFTSQAEPGDTLSVAVFSGMLGVTAVGIFRNSRFAKCLIH
jgi:hypothetical protein